MILKLTEFADNPKPHPQFGNQLTLTSTNGLILLDTTGKFLTTGNYIVTISKVQTAPVTTVTHTDDYEEHD